VADNETREFSCGMQEAMWERKSGTMVSEETNVWPEGLVIE